MIPERLISDLAGYYGKEYNPLQTAEILARLKGYSDDQIQMIYNALIDNCKARPLVADIKRITSAINQDLQTARWQPEQEEAPEEKKCQLCNGRGYFRIPIKRLQTVYATTVVCRCAAGNKYVQPGRMRYGGEPLICGQQAQALVKSGAVDCYDDYVGLYWREIIENQDD